MSLINTPGADCKMQFENVVLLSFVPGGIASAEAGRGTDDSSAHAVTVAPPPTPSDTARLLFRQIGLVLGSRGRSDGDR